MNIDNGLTNGVVFIDLKKAFDTIDHQIILQKLKNYGCNENSLTWFHLYLTDRTQKCQVNGQLSDSVSVASYSFIYLCCRSYKPVDHILLSPSQRREAPLGEGY